MERENELRYTSVGSLLIHGPEVLHDDYASRLQKAMGGALPQMDVCVKNLSLSAAVTVAFKSDSKTHELPTVGNVFKRAARALGSRKKQQQVHKSILHQVNAVFRPGTMTLVLGQPGSGKSSLLKVLSGRFPMNKNISIDGEITYNGILSDAMAKHLPQFVSYVPQRDRHYPMLTVKETLKFAHECCGAELSAQDEQQFTHGSADENKAALEAARAMYRHYPDIITQQLGLEHCQDTIVGNAMLRGVSGGERKRVTTGEMSFGNKHVMVMDEISTGLDSAATFDIVKTQRSIAQKLRKTVVMALLQPSPEVFDLFDFVMVLSEGYVLYSGPRDQALPYFASLGFHCPAGRDAAEFLLDIATDKQLQYTTSASAAKMMPQSPRDFAEVFQDSSIHAQTMQQLDAPLLNSFCGEVTQYFMDVPEFHQTYWSSTKTLLARELKVTWRNKALIKGKAFVLGVIGLIYSLLFYQFDVKNPQVVIGTIFPAILFFTLGQGAQLPRFMDAREIFYKQRGANFYRTSSYVIASAFNQIPLAAIESIFFSLLVYWLCGFVADVGAFLMFVLIIFVTNLAFAAWTFFLSSLSPNVHVAEPVNLLTILMYTLFAGFIITHDDIPVYFQWIYWSNPVAWAVRSLAINQYGNHRFDNCHYDGVDYCAMFKKKMGVYSLEAYDIYTDEVWVWFGLAFMLASFGFYMMISCLILENVRYEVTAHHTVAADDEDNVPMMEGELCKIDVESSSSAYIISESPREYTTDVLCEVEVTRKVPVTLAFKDLYYSVPNPANPKEDLELLKGISGFAKPGTITALMGSSGAGKTTLMDVIAGRKTGGKITGQILLNGYEATDLAIRRATGYCEQMDIHMEASTFREALTFSAFLRQSADVPDVQKYDAVEESLELLDLHPIADKIIRGSSVEQMKRLTIGVELAAQPSVLFLDEPTSGLDARAAKLIMDGVRKVADSGRTVVCTIHQPSAEVFQVFDSLLLLKRGGETVFFGELGKDASELVQYFESIDGVAKLEPGYNPATWMLEVIGAGVGNSASQDFVSIFKNSKKKALLDRDLAKDGVSRPAAGVPELVFKSKRAASSYMQAKLLVTRFLDTYWRTPAYVITRTVVFTVLALVFGLAFRQVDYATYHGINAGVGMIFTATLFLGVIALKSVQPLMFDTRDVFYRERASQTYNALWFFVGSSIAEIPYVFFSVLVFSAIFFPLVGFSGGITSLQFWVHLSLHVLLQTYLGQFLAFSLPTLEVSATIATMVIAITFLFMGFNPPASLIPTGYKWLHSITPPKYTLAILSSALFGNCDEPSDVACQHLQQLPPTLPQGLSVKQYIDTVFHASYDDMWLNFAVIMAFIVAFRVLALLALRFINHQKK